MPRRRRFDRVTNVPGDSALVNVHGDTTHVRRHAGRIFVEGEEVRRRKINMRGDNTHIHVHTGTGRRREREAVRPQPHIDFEARRREIEAMMEKRRRQIAGLIKMPVRTPEEIRQNVAFNQAQAVQARTKAFRDKTHPVRSAFGSWNPFNVSNAWYFHPLHTLNRLFPIRIATFGIGRKSRRRQVADYQANAAGRARAFEEARVGERAQATLNAYSQTVNGAFEEFQRTGDNAVFERAVSDAEKWFDAQVSGTAGLMADYGRATGRKR